MEFKNLAEVAKLEEVPEGASVLAATADGEVVRVPGEGLGGSGGGAGVLAVELEIANDMSSASSAMSYEEIAEALNNGAYVYGVSRSGSGSSRAYMYLSVATYSVDGVIFSTIVPSSNTMLGALLVTVGRTETTTQMFMYNFA